MWARLASHAPRFAAETFAAWFRGHVPRDESAPAVLLWPDTFTNYFEPAVGIAAVEVLEAAGFRVMLPGRPVCCGRPLHDYGMLDLAQNTNQRVRKIATDLVRGRVAAADLRSTSLPRTS